MIIGVFIINFDGDVLVQKPFMSSIHLWSPEKFYENAVQHNLKHVIPPCVQIDKLYYVHLKKDDVYVVAVLETPEISSLMLIESIHTSIKGCTDLIGDLTSHNIVDHVAVVYELIINIFGLCQPGSISLNSVNECKQLGDATEPQKLFPLVPENIFGVTTSKENQYIKASSASKVPLASHKEKSNEIFIDIMEHLTAIIDPKGQMTYTDVKGQISSKSYLSSPVQLHISLLENVVTNGKGEPGKIVLTSTRFHGVSDGSSEDTNPSIIKHLSYPGHSDILDYQIDASHLTPPFTMYHNFTKSKKGSMTELFLNCKIFCSLPAGICATNWSGTLPLPSNLHSVRAVSSLQSMTFSEDDKHTVLKFCTDLFPSQSHHSVSITLLLNEQLPHMRYQMPFLNIQFEIPDLCISNMNINSLKIHHVATNMSQSASKWVRRLTSCKDFQFQLKDWMDE